MISSISTRTLGVAWNQKGQSTSLLPGNRGGQFADKLKESYLENKHMRQNKGREINERKNGMDGIHKEEAERNVVSCSRRTVGNGGVVGVGYRGDVIPR